MSKVAAVVNKVVITVGDVLVDSVPEYVAVFDDCLTELLFVDVNGSFVTVEFEEIDITLFFVEYVAEPVDGCFMTLVVLTVDVLGLYIGDTDVWVDVGRPLAVVA